MEWILFDVKWVDSCTINSRGIVCNINWKRVLRRITLLLMRWEEDGYVHCVSTVLLRGGQPGSPLWIRQRIEDEQTWNGVKSCIFHLGTCQDLAYNAVLLSKDLFGDKSFNSIQKMGKMTKKKKLTHLQEEIENSKNADEHTARDKHLKFTDVVSYASDPTLIR